MSNSVDTENIVATLRGIRKDILHSSCPISTSNPFSNNSTSSPEWIRRYDPNTNQYSYFHSTTHSIYPSNPWLSSTSSETILPRKDEWIRMYDEREGKFFLFQPSSGREQWTFPTSESTVDKQL